MSTRDRVDRDVEQLVEENGINDTIAALARYCQRRYTNQTLFRRLNKIYEWLKQ